MKIESIKYEKGNYWVGKINNTYQVFKNVLTHSVADSTYEKTADGLSIAIARCNYLAKKEHEKKTKTYKHGDI